MPNENDITLSYEVLDTKLKEANDKIAKLESTIEDMKKVIKTVATSSSSDGENSNDKQDTKTKVSEDFIKEVILGK